jgi:hypothetical protein
VRAQLCLAVAPPRQARRVRSAAKTDARSLTAPVAGSERPSAAALISRGRRGGGQLLRKGYGQTAGLAVRGRLSPPLPNLRNEPIYRLRADANSLGGLVTRQSRAPGVQKDPGLPLTNCGVTATTVVQREAIRLPIEGRSRKE